jgi:acyl carrier protein
MDDLKDMLVRCAGVPASMVVDDPEASLIDLGIDSAGLLGLQLEIEQRYGIVVGEADLPHLLTVGSALAHVNRLLAVRPGSESAARP